MKPRACLTNVECDHLNMWMVQETQAREELALASARQSDALRRREAKLLEREFSSMSALAERLSHLGEQRDALVTSILARIGLRGVQVRISALVGLAPDARKPQLEARLIKLREAARTAADANRRNLLVAKAQLSFGQAVLRSAFGDGDGSIGRTYDSRAAPRESRPLTTYLDQEL